MIETMRLGIVICDRYRACAGGKCFRAMRRREGAFSIYQGRAIELVGYTSCGGCPGGNIEYAPAEMKKNGAQVIHLATGLIVGYPPCPRIASFCSFIRTKYELEVVVGTHPIPEKYWRTHGQLGTWDGPRWQALLQPTATTAEVRVSYD
jgi:predicted metal-binding protein